MDVDQIVKDLQEKVRMPMLNYDVRTPLLTCRT